MPNPRRRRFSVQNSISNANEGKTQTGIQTYEDINDGDPDIRHIAQNLVSMKSNRARTRVQSMNSKYYPPLEILVESESELSVITGVPGRPLDRVSKEVTASSSNIDLLNLIKTTENTPPLGFKENERNSRRRTEVREGNTVRRDRYSRQHRIKVRSPKRRMTITNGPSKTCNYITIGINTFRDDDNLDNNATANVLSTSDITENAATDIVIVSSTNSMEDMCRICHGGESLTSELGEMISACSCRGTVGRVHVKCLEHWLTESGKSRCELCGTRYAMRRVHRYGVLKALFMWFLSQNTKQLMVDSLGIMLMSPLAILAAWLSGKTLAGLMARDAQMTPWPLASTFVLACMTLVCYYCWIVSAFTRHALGWWIWYRSQYEVRLQLSAE